MKKLIAATLLTVVAASSAMAGGNYDRHLYEQARAGNFFAHLQLQDRCNGNIQSACVYLDRLYQEGPLL